jgi:uncharacterized integral membrane protein
MNRLQNVVFAVLVVLLLLFAAFNWQLVWRPVEVVFLFQDFSVRIILWLILGGIVGGGVLRALAEVDFRTRRRRADKEIHLIKSRAFDGLTGEFDKMVHQLQDQLGERIQSMLSERGVGKEADAAAPDPPEDPDGEPPELSPETTATLAELKAEPEPKEEDEEAEKAAADKKPRRSRRKKT